MEKREFSTPLGDVWLWGEKEAFEGSKPLVFAILGAFNIEFRWPDLIPERLPEVSVITTQLPGNHCPHPLTHSIGAYAAAFSPIVASFRRPTIILGASIGALVGFAMRATNVRGIVALDPPIHTAKLWPLIDDFRQKLSNSPADERLREFVWNVFGVAANGQEDRDYSNLIAQISSRTILMLGEDPLFPEREIASIPSLLDEADRQAFRSQPLVNIWRIRGVGHNIVHGGYGFVIDALRWLVENEIKVNGGPGEDRPPPRPHAPGASR